MAKQKSYPVRRVFSNTQRYISVLLVFMMLAILLQFRYFAELLAKIIEPVPENQGFVADRIQEVAGGLVLLGAGLVLLKASAVFVAVPFVGIGLAVIGAGFLVYGAVRVYNAVMPKKIDGSFLGLDLW